MTANSEDIDKLIPDPARQEMAKAYAKTRRYFGIGNLTLGFAILLFLLLSGFSVRLAGLFSLPVAGKAAIYFVIVMLVHSVLSAPLSYFGGFVLSRRYGIAAQKLPGWLLDQVKGRLLGLIFGAGISALIYWLLASFPEIWWLLAWVALLVVTLVMTIIAPVVLVPIFFKMKPLEDTDLKARLERLTRKAKAGVQGIYTIGFGAKITAANAALMGMGKTRRIVLSDTLLSAYSPSEVEVVTAHELGHHAHRDTMRLFLFQGAILVILFDLVNLLLGVGVDALGYEGISDVAAFPLLMIISGVLSALAAPLTNAFSRYVESAADEYALQLSDDPVAFISAMTKLTDQNLSVAKPGRWEELLLYDHPSYIQRVQHARSYIKTKPQ